MKIVFLFFVMTLSQLSFAKDLSTLEKGDRASLSIRFSNYAIKTPKNLKNTILDDIEKLGALELTEKNDLELVKNALLTLILIDKTDVPRDGISTLSESYGKNKDLYKKAASLIQTEKNKKQLTELLQMMNDFDENGNG